MRADSQQMHPSSTWDSGAGFRSRKAPADPEAFAAIMKVPELPRSSAWDPVWVWQHHMGPVNLWFAELLANEMDLRPGMRVLDMGCGSAATSLFLALELGVEVWAADLWIAPTDNLARIRGAGLGDRVFPLRVEATALPFADDFFDALFSVDAYHYFGMGDDYLATYARMVKPGGQIGVIVPGDSNDDAPEWESFRSARWWRDLWERSGVVDIEVADAPAEGRDLWIRFLDAGVIWDGKGTRETEPDSEYLFHPRGAGLGFTRIVARRRG
jgi:SAM-dependent methyltransferase